ncbi:Zinc finger, RAN-binding domain containing 2 [Perkinsus olseni]|uniref:Zinc finger, RAN-binding domain containing 2 n=1 Tax=Perkinsus olseni TaxID=32597 RepID=A0A7J6LBH5_PEROL|nr:Zinc finger, RAN-binding domain containing 2 [Perkinsus olseni]
MITYDNDQSAVKLILQRSGSVFPRALLPALTAALITFGLGFDAVSGWIPAEIQHPFSVQIFAIILGYVIVFRTNMALGRYREGMSSVQQMVSKWGDAFVEISGFIAVSKERLDKDKVTLPQEGIIYPGEFCEASIQLANGGESRLSVKLLEELSCRIVHWFSLLNAVATISLNDGEVDLEKSFIVYSLKGASPWGACQTSDRLGSIRASSSSSVVLEPVGPVDLSTSKLPIIGECTRTEKNALAGKSDKPLVVAGWITEEITRACLDGLLLIPPPILSRCYQEVSNGMLGYNQAFKVSLVPFPFPFAQMLALLLVVFLLILPMMVLRMTQSAVLSPILSFFCLLGYWGLNEIAVELENPFGDDDNDLPLKHVHTAFVKGIRDCADDFITADSGRQASGQTADAGPSDELKKVQRELGLLGVPVSRYFSQRSSLEELSTLSKSELIAKFESAEVATRIHRDVFRLIGELSEGDTVPLPVPVALPSVLFMITYDNKQSSLFLILRYTGSVFPRTLLPSLFSTAFAAGIILDVLPFVPPTIEHPFAVQIFAIILGYLIVFRTDMALNRYWEGVTNVHLMASKWGDAFMQINSFINVTIRTCSSDQQRKELEVVRSRTLHWFSLLSAIAIANLNGKDISDLRTAFKHRTIHRLRAGVTAGRLNEVVKVTSKERRELTPAGEKKRTLLSFVGERLSQYREEAGLGRLVIIGPCSEDELKDSEDKTWIIPVWIEEALTRICVNGLIKVPAPIVSRCYQEISTGMMGYNQALKVSQVPFPFPFAQMVSLLLLIFLFMCPIMVVKMTEGAALSPILSFFCLLGYWGLNEIAVELENPFGDDDNDLPLETIHTEFVDSLHTCATVGPAKPFHHPSLAEMTDQQLEAITKASKLALSRVNHAEGTVQSSVSQQFSAVAKINDELERVGVEDRRLRFGPCVTLEDLTLLTMADLQELLGPAALRVYSDMITYDNKQSAFRLILQLSGSVFPRAVPAGVVAAVIAMCLGLDVLPFIPPSIDHPFAVQIFAIVLGYVIVFRTNMALGRSPVMVSKWGDAFMQINAFINVRIRSAEDDPQLVPSPSSHRLFQKHFRKYIFSVFIRVDLVNGFGYRPLENNKHVGRRSFLQGRETGRRGIRRGSLLLPRASVMMMMEPPVAGGSMLERMNSSAVAAYNVSRLTVVGECSEEEVRHLEECSDKGLVVARWISETVSRSCLEGLITVPPPILSRCYQEISNGMLGFNQAFRVTLVPFPFPFAQLLALLLLVFVVICPTMVVKMTVGKILSPVLSFFAVLGYWGLNQIAVELENPFGDDKNDLPLEHVHTAFVDGIHDCAFAGLAETEVADGRRLKQGPAPTAPAEVAPTRAAPLEGISEYSMFGARTVVTGDPLAMQFNQELATQRALPAECLFSRRLKFCDLLLFRESDLAVKFASEALGREVFR